MKRNALDALLGPPRPAPAGDEDSADVQIRRLALAAHRDYDRGARACVRVAVVAPEALASATGVSQGRLVDSAGAEVPLPEGASFTPPFVHQLFPLERLFGYRGDVSLRVWLRDPDLALAVTGEAPGGAMPPDGAPVAVPAGPGGKAFVMRVPPDDVLTCIAPLLPPGYPRSALAARIGGGGGGGAPPLPLRFFPPDAPPAALDGTPAAPAGGVAAAAHPLAQWAPPGEVVARYAAAERAFVVHAWTPSESAEGARYAARLETLAPWVIETASAVDFSDDRWRVYATFEALPAGACRFALVGYATTYRFTHPLREHRPTALRLAQLVVLPRFQRAGHGEALLRAVHDAAEALDALDVSVESPCEGMTRLRDAFDCARAWRGRVFAFLPGWSDAEEAGDSVGHTTRVSGDAALGLVVALSDEHAARAAGVLRCTVAQARKVYLALLLGRCDCSEVGGARDERLSTALRVLAKRAALAASPDVRAIADPVARKAALSDAWVEALADATAALARVRTRAGARLCTKKAAEAASDAWQALLAEQGGGSDSDAPEASR